MPSPSIKGSAAETSAGAAAPVAAVAALPLVCQEEALATAPSHVEGQMMRVPWLCMDVARTHSTAGFVLFCISPRIFSVLHFDTGVLPIRTNGSDSWDIYAAAVVKFSIAPIGQIAHVCLYAAPLPQQGRVCTGTTIWHRAHRSDGTGGALTKLEPQYLKSLFCTGIGKMASRERTEEANI